MHCNTRNIIFFVGPVQPTTQQMYMFLLYVEGDSKNTRAPTTF